MTAAIADLARDMADDEALVIFPEGGNFTKRRRLRAIERLRMKGHDDEAEKAEAMTTCSRAQPGGTFAAVMPCLMLTWSSLRIPVWSS